MHKRATAFITYIRHFFRYMLYLREILVGHVLLLLAGGFAISRIEGLELGESIYFACITGLTIGYGDITPETALGKVMSVAIGLVGLLFTGIVIAIATRALAATAEEYKKHE
jgi:voltage-gated potassium channel